jgi:hypothetical protein
MTIKERIAKALMRSRTGLTRKELFDKIDPTNTIRIDSISDALTLLKKSGHAEKTGQDHGARWQITPQGRAYYSELNDDETDNKTQQDSIQSIQQHEPLALDSGQRPERQSNTLMAKGNENPIDDNNTQPEQMESLQNQLAQTENDQQFQSDEIPHTPITYDPFGDIYTQLQQAQQMLQNIKLPESPRIQNKQEKLATLRLVQQTIGLFNGDVEDILQQIYQDINQMEAA